MVPADDLSPCFYCDTDQRILCENQPDKAEVPIFLFLHRKCIILCFLRHHRYILQIVHSDYILSFKCRFNPTNSLCVVSSFTKYKALHRKMKNEKINNLENETRALKLII